MKRFNLIQDITIIVIGLFLGFTLGADWQKQKETHDHQAVHVTEKGGHSGRWECR